MTNSLAILARSIVRLYPRAWRERYEDEVRALLAETTVTPAVVVDLLRGAAREWARAWAQPGVPVNLDREALRDFVRTTGAALAAGTASWLLSRELLSWGSVSDDDSRLWLLMAGGLYAMFRLLHVQIRRVRIQKRARVAGAPPSPEAMIAAGLGRAEFWLCVAFIIAFMAVSWTSDSAQQGIGYWMRWLSALVNFNLLRNSSRTVLARNDLIQRLYKAQH